MSLSTPARSSAADAAILVGIVACTALFYAAWLGLYLDDWYFFSLMRESPDQSVAGLYRTLTAFPNLAVRPGQVAWLVAAYKLSPGAIWPVHVAIQVAFAAAVALLYAGMRKIPCCRSAAFPVVLIYACLANFTTARIWFAAHQATLSLLFFALTFYLVARAAEAQRARFGLAAAVFATSAAGNLCYEHFGFLLPLLPLFVWRGRDLAWSEILADRRFRLASAAALGGFVLTSAYKLGIGFGVGAVTKGVGLLAWAAGAATMYGEAAFNTFGTAYLFSPIAALGIAAAPDFQVAAAGAAAIVLLALLWRFRPWQREAAAADPPQASPLFLAGAGAVAFVMGYVPFLPNLWYLASPWGPNNRANVAAALGAALMIHAAFCWLERRVPRLARWSIVALCVVGVFLQVSIGRMWVRASAEQHRLLSEIRAVQPALGEDRVLLVYGLCPYVRAGPVFAFRGWDLTYALAGNGMPDITADILTPGSRIDPGGLVVADPVFNSYRRYRYGSFAILDRADKSVVPVDSAVAAQAYFASRSLELPTGCRYHKQTGAALY